MTATSQARVEANRRNALHSTGPRTAEGKANSRRNGLKHGMAGRGVVVSEQDAPEVERRERALLAEMAPRSALGAILVGQIATLSVRMERGAKQEEAATATRVRHAPEAFDRRRLEHAKALFEAMQQADDPRPLARELRQSPEGIDRLADAWRDLRADLTCPGRTRWSPEGLTMAARMAGLRLVELEGSPLEALTRATWGNLQGLAEADGAGLDDPGRRRWAADRLVEWVDEELGGLEALRESLDLESIELDRAGAADVALFDPSREAGLARRYESEARRGFFRALADFRRAEAEFEGEAADRPSAASVADPAPEVAAAAASLGSCRERPTAVASGCQPGPDRVAPGLVRPASTGGSYARGLDGRVLAVGRATFGAG